MTYRKDSNYFFPLFFVTLLSLLLSLSESSEVYVNTTNVDSRAYAVSPDGNALYIATTTRQIRRYNYTKFIYTPSFTYSTSHTKDIRVIGVSHGEYYFATGSQDYLIQVVIAFTQTKVCTLEHYNQIRALKFDPNHQEILFAASVDDMIRKWNVSNCQLVAGKDIGYSVHTMDINSAGNQLIYGTLQGHVGYIDSDLTTPVTSTSAHAFAVMNVFYTYGSYYASFGHDSLAILWNSGTKIDDDTSTTSDRTIQCSLYVRAVYNSTFRLASCFDQSRTVKTFSISNTTIKQIVSHGFQSQPNFAINKYIGEDEQMWTMLFSNGVIGTHYIYDDSVSKCSPHFGELQSQNVCKFCHFMMDGCHFCSDQSTCETCSIGFYRNGNDCIKCPDDCAKCSSANNCQQCAVGYQEIGNSGKCTPKPASEQGCFEYQSTNNKCDQAGNGYYINSQRIKPCSDANTGCLECKQSNGNCYTCETGYYVNSNACSSCSTAMSGCLACSNSTQCLHCAVAFKDNGFNRQCSDCHGTCLTCGPYYDQCLTCNSTLNRQIDTEAKECPCSDGYYDRQPSSFSCSLCSSVLDHCYKCDNSTICIECQPFYYFVTNGGVKQCEACSPYCQTCQVDSDVCATCNSLTYFRVLSGTTCVCDTGYVSIGGSVPCSQCSVLNDGCLDCTNETMCVSCDTGYYLKQYNASTHLCKPCPYYCPDCTVNATNDVICNSCPASTFRTLSADGMCECDSGYFDDNQTLTCQACGDVLDNCLTCTNRTVCVSCAPGMYTDASNTICAPCRSTCLTCGAYFDECATCDPGSNRVLVGNKCACLSHTYEDGGTCNLCSDAIENCNSCENPYLCTGCQAGFTLQSDLKACINCQAQINGCLTCTSPTECTTCLSPFSLINDFCRCPMDKYTSEEEWGTCQDYGIPGIVSSLGVQLEVHQHQNNSLIVFIRFRAVVLYVLNQQLEDSILLKVNGQIVPITFDFVDNNRIHIRTELQQELYRPNIRVIFSQDVFYNEKLLTLGNLEEQASMARFYKYEESTIKSTQAIRDTLTYLLYILKWVLFGMSIVGLGHLLYPFVIFISIIPIFLMLNMSLPSNLSDVLEGMLSFQVKGIVPLMEMNSDYFVIFPPMTYDYYRLFDYFLFAKLGDILTILLVNVMTKFDQGIVRMFPPGKIRRYLYQSLVRRGYAVMSICILSFLPSFMIFTSVMINWVQWEQMGEIFNYCSCVFVCGFYLAYIFNHASNLSGTKQLKNIQNQHCFNGINSQDPAAPKTTLMSIITDLWLAASLPIIGPMPYFCSSLFLLSLRAIMHLRLNFYVGKIHFSLRTLQNLMMIAIFAIMLVFYLGQSKIKLTFISSQKLGMVCSILILLFIVFTLTQKIIYMLKLETDWVKTKTVKTKNGAEQDQVIFAQRVEEEDEDEVQNEAQSTHSRKMVEFLGSNTGFNGRDFGRTQRDPSNNGPMNQSKSFHNSAANNIDKNRSTMDFGNNYSTYNHPQNREIYNTGFNRSLGTPQMGKLGQTKGTGDFFNNTMKTETKEKQIRIKSANTSKYARNHLQLRYNAHNIMTREPDTYE